MEKETTTIMIYTEDHKVLTEMCNKGENYRDKFHEIIKFKLNSKEVKQNGRN